MHALNQKRTAGKCCQQAGLSRCGGIGDKLRVAAGRGVRGQRKNIGSGNEGTKG